MYLKVTGVSEETTDKDGSKYTRVTTVEVTGPDRRAKPTEAKKTPTKKNNWRKKTAQNASPGDDEQEADDQMDQNPYGIQKSAGLKDLLQDGNSDEEDVLLQQQENNKALHKEKEPGWTKE